MRRTNLLRVGMGVAGVVAAAWLSGCESETNAPSSSSGAVPDASFTVDSGGSSSGDLDSGSTDGGGPTDGGGGDAGGDFTSPGIGLANFYDVPLDLCIKPQGASDYTALYGAEGGVPVGALGVVRPVPVGAEVKWIVATAGCAAPGIYTPGVLTSPTTQRLITVVRKQPLDDARSVFMRGAQHVAGKDNVYYARLGRDATFTPAGGAAITIRDDRVNALDPNLSGTLLLTAPAGDYTKALKTAAGASIIIETPTGILVCDLAAPPNGHLVPCGGPVRSP
ncbi:MAG: hypothetical protein JST00_17525 [Deltaproteobacteria bacterium]|nr:hypothetical protein [Deltaproteobacteria bacterium]